MPLKKVNFHCLNMHQNYCYSSVFKKLKVFYTTVTIIFFFYLFIIDNMFSLFIIYQYFFGTKTKLTTQRCIPKIYQNKIRNKHAFMLNFFGHYYYAIPVQFLKKLDLLFLFSHHFL